MGAPTVARRGQPHQFDPGVARCRCRRPWRGGHGPGDGLDHRAVRSPAGGVVGGDAEGVAGAVVQPRGCVAASGRLGDGLPRSGRGLALDAVLVDLRPAVAGRSQPRQFDPGVARLRCRRSGGGRRGHGGEGEVGRWCANHPGGRVRRDAGVDLGGTGRAAGDRNGGGGECDEDGAPGAMDEVHGCSLSFRRMPRWHPPTRQ